MSLSMYDRITLPAFANKPELVKPKTYKGFSTVNKQSEQYSLYDFELIKQDIQNHFHVRQGERLMQPNFGTIIWDLLFEPLTNEIKDMILRDINNIINYDPRVQIGDAIVTTYESGIQIEFSLTFTPYNVTEKIKMRFDQQQGL
jgi:phage baseplate assembly protein W